MTSTLPATSNDLSGGKAQEPASVVQTVSAQIAARLKSAGTSFLANDNIADFILPGELQALEAEVGDRVRDLLRALVIDIENDHNTQETAERVARMYLHEVFKGRYHQQPKVASFPNVKELDEITPSVRSRCAQPVPTTWFRSWGTAGSGSSPAAVSSACPNSLGSPTGCFHALTSRKRP